MDGLVVRVHNLGTWLSGFLGSVPAGRLDDFPRSLPERIDRSPPIFDDAMSDDQKTVWFSAVAAHEKQQWDEFYGSYFPEAVASGKQKPTPGDIGRLSKLLRSAMLKIRKQRNTFTAHRDKNATDPATFEEMKEALSFLEKTIRDLYHLHTMESIIDEGFAARPGVSGKSLVALIAVL
jgi:hypothetical protein